MYPSRALIENIGWWITLSAWVFGVIAGVILARFLTGLFFRYIKKKTLPRKFVLWRNRYVWGFLVVFGFLYFALLVDVYLIEPNWVVVTRTEINSPKVAHKSGGIRIVHVSDLHIENDSWNFQKITNMINEKSPDFILLTGDYLNDSSAIPKLIDFLKSLEAKSGVYAVTGNWDEHMGKGLRDVFARAGIALLEREGFRHNVRGTVVDIYGVRWGYGWGFERVRKNINENHLNVLLYHSPVSKIFDMAEKDGIDLMLSGDTHGGQVWLPFYGPVEQTISLERSYISGLYRKNRERPGEGEAFLYVNRGIGMRAGNLPRIRFLCRPEIAVIDVLPRPVSPEIKK